jgi:hypothetical protein
MNFMSILSLGEVSQDGLAFTRNRPSAGQLGPSLGWAGGGPARFIKSQIWGLFLGKKRPRRTGANRGRRQRGNPRRLGAAIPITTSSTAVWFNILINKAASPCCSPKS